jgi:signal recognition particle GTPase
MNVCPVDTYGSACALSMLTHSLRVVGATLPPAGKTTSCTKFAYYYKRKGWKTCLVSAEAEESSALAYLRERARSHVRSMLMRLRMCIRFVLLA